MTRNLQRAIPDNGVSPPDQAQVQQSILETFIYADLFNYPQAAAEVVRYLTVPAQPDVIQRLLDDSVVQGSLVRSNGYFALPDREKLIALREDREKIAQGKWAAARRYAGWLALMPFVRLVAVTGTLAVNNVAEADDIDVFIVTSPDRLWLCRAFVILVVRLAKLQGHELCPNYFVSERQLRFSEHNFFVARELAQMVPLYGIETYRCIRKHNAWVEEFLPQAGDAPNSGQPIVQSGPIGRAFKRVAEIILKTPPGGWLERWEMRRKVRKLSQEAVLAQAEKSSVFTADCCKGHFDHHDNTIPTRFRRRLSKNVLPRTGHSPTQ